MILAAVAAAYLLVMLSNFKPKPSRQLPGQIAVNGVGALIGVISSLVGIGGGARTFFGISPRMLLENKIQIVSAMFPVYISA